MNEIRSSLEPGAIAAIAFLAIVILLLAYAAIHAKKRRQAFDQLMPQLGIERIDPPEPGDVLPDLLFHPNGFEGAPASWGKWQLLRSRVLQAWSGSSAGRSVLILDVSQDRSRTNMSGQKDEASRERQENATVIRCDPGPGGPPDFLIWEQVLFKSQVRGQRAIHGSDQIGEHYFLFSDAPDEDLEPWITPALRETLGRHRLWRIATHNGVVFLSRGTSQQQPDEFRSFLSEGEALLAALLGRG